MVKCNGVSAFQVLKYTLECSLCLAKNVMSMVWIGELTNFAIKKVVFKFPSPKICVLTFRHNNLINIFSNYSICNVKYVSFKCFFTVY